MRLFLNSVTLIFTILIVLFTACNRSSNKTLKIAATSVPHAEILEFIKPDLQKLSIHLEILVIDDFNILNRSLADGEIDANFFQHLPFLESQKSDFGYQLEPLVFVHIEPMALYSKKIHSLKDLKNQATIAIPSDPSNQARALILCEQAGLLSLKSHHATTSIQDINHNPKQLKFIEMDSALLSRALDDVDLAAITTNFALLADLSPQKENLAIEDTQSRFVNVVVIRQGEDHKKELQALKSALTSSKVHEWIQQNYEGAVIPVF